MLSWSTIVSAPPCRRSAGILVVGATRPRRAAVIATGVASAFFGPLARNAILKATDASSFFHDAPDTGLPGLLAGHRQWGVRTCCGHRAARDRGHGPRHRQPGRASHCDSGFAGRRPPLLNRRRPRRSRPCRLKRRGSLAHAMVVSRHADRVTSSTTAAWMCSIRARSPLPRVNFSGTSPPSLTVSLVPSKNAVPWSGDWSLLSSG